jgi:glutathione S-transferase
LYGAEFSYYSGKTRSYLLHKGIPFVEKSASAWIYLGLLPRHVGVPVVPVVLTPQGEWLQDTSVIFDVLESRYSPRPALPATPVLRLCAYLFELWGDEFLLPLAMHTRWNRPGHLSWYAQEAGRTLLPGFPAFLQRLMGRKIANEMRGHATTLGFGADMAQVLDRFARIQLDALDTHFAEHRFLFGGRPSLGDYGLIGPLYAHIGRDPLSKRDLIDPRPHLQAWIARMFDPTSSAGGEFFAEDQVPITLQPALRSIFDEMLPFVAACADEVRKTPALPHDTRSAPRFLGPISYPLAGAVHRRLAASYPVWMMERLRAACGAQSADDQRAVSEWLAVTRGSALLDMQIPPVVRVKLSAAHVAAHPPPAPRQGG